MHRGGLPLAPSREHFARVRWWTLGGYVAIWCVVHFLRSARWHFLLEPIAKVPMRRVLSVSFLGFAAIALLPLRTGEAVRPLLIRRRDELSGWAATGTIAAERILDGLVLSLMLLAGLSLSTPLSPLPDHIGNLPISPALVPRAAYLALSVFGLAFTVMGIFYVKRDWARRTTEQVIGIVSPRLATWLADRVENVAEGLRFLPNVRYSAPFVAMTVAYWVVNAAGTLAARLGLWLRRFHAASSMRRDRRRRARHPRPERAGFLRGVSASVLRRARRVLSARHGDRPRRGVRAPRVFGAARHDRPGGGARRVPRPAERPRSHAGDASASTAENLAAGSQVR